jgi:hypothetical protein
MKIAALLTILLLSACATHPASIKPVAVEQDRFMAMSCDELAARDYQIDADLRRFVNSQKRARVGDALTWPVPVSRIFGKNKRNVREIAVLRGEQEAVTKARAAKCPAV